MNGQHKKLKTIVFVLLFTARLCHGQQDSIQFGNASYYANKFNNRITSSGEIFNNDSLFAAHKTLGFGTFVRVTSLTDSSSVIVKINDRLPRQSTRTIDLSQAAARKLHMIQKGVIKVKLEIIRKENN